MCACFWFIVDIEDCKWECVWINCLSIDHMYSMYLNLQEFTVILGSTYGALYMYYSWTNSYCTGIDFGTKKF